MVSIYCDNEEDPTEEENENEVVNMCFMAINEQDEVIFNPSCENLRIDFEELYGDLEKLRLKNVSIKKKVLNLEDKLKDMQKSFEKVETKKIYLKKNDWLTHSLSNLSCGQKTN